MAYSAKRGKLFQAGPGRRIVLWLGLTALVIGLLLVWQPDSLGQLVHRNGFEGDRPTWIRGQADVDFKEEVHDMSDKNAHTGQLSEHWKFVAKVGSRITYLYPVGKAPLGEELSASIWVKANRPGMQLMARLVLPRERNAENLDEPLTTLLRGNTYQLAGRWQRLEIGRPVKLAKEQQQLLRAELQRDIDITDAYVDRLEMNLYGGPGQHEIWVDDLQVVPVVAEERRDLAPEKGMPVSRTPIQPGRGGIVKLNQERLMVNGKRFFLRGIRPGNLPLQAIRDAGFNTVWFDVDTKPERVEKAVKLGLWVAAGLPGLNGSQSFTSDQLEPYMARFLRGQSVLFWTLGGGRTREESPALSRTAQAVRAVDPNRPIAADVWDGFGPYSRNLDMLGAHRWPLMTSVELSQYREWLNQRRLLARPGTYMWTWVQTHMPEWYTNLLNDTHGIPGQPTDLAGPQPEQLRLLSYMALASGCQGLGFWSDPHLGRSLGRDRFFALALINQEMHMMEPLLLSVRDAPRWVDTTSPSVKAAVFRTGKGVLALPIWQGAGSQFVPGQSAAAQLTMVIPQVPQGTQAWEISPAEIRSLPTKRVPGGVQVTLPEFGLTSAIVFTADINLVVRFQDHVRKTRKLAAQWAHDLAETEMEKVMQVADQLEAEGHKVEGAAVLKRNAQRRLQDAISYFNGGNYRQAYAESQRALRPVRIMMRGHWDEAVRDLPSPTASPYAVSYYTLPRHWKLMEQVRRLEGQGNFANLLPGGNFEQDNAPNAWSSQEGTLDKVAMGAWRVVEEAHEGKRCLKMEITPKDVEKAPVALERTYLAINSLAVEMKPGSLVRITGWVRIPKPIKASVDGVLVYDSSGGEPLSVRLKGPLPWRQFTLYRWVPASGAINVTLALTGIGTAYFDDVRIEKLLDGSSRLIEVSTEENPQR